MGNDLKKLLKKIDDLTMDVEEHSRDYETHYSILNDWYLQLNIIHADILDLHHKLKKWKTNITG